MAAKLDGNETNTGSGAPMALEPYIPAHATLPEFTPRALLLGTVLGMIFGASSLYLVLKIGLTVSASIPVTVISLSLFRILSKAGVRDATILENNIVQTAGSAGESIAFGVGVTMPAILILGFDLELGRILLVALLGGLLGVLMMIPLRRALIVQQHGILKYPEGTACAAVLKAGASKESVSARVREAHPESPALSRGREASGMTIFTGFGIGLFYKSAMVALKGWKEVPEKIFGAPFKAGSVSAEISPELLGVGYIIGPRIASIMAAGGVLAYLVLIPMIRFFGEGMSEALPPASRPIREMGPDDIRGEYILYIGAGAVAAGGIISVFRSLPLIWHGIRAGLRDFGISAQSGAVSRLDRDLPIKRVLIGCAALIVAIRFAPPLHVNWLGALLIVLFGFLFVTVSSRLTGEIGSSSNPISGMTVATLLLTCLIFLAVGWTGGAYYVTALSVGAVVCIAASNGGTTSQDLKTGFLVGATPRSQQWALLIGVTASALILGPILLRLNDAGTVYVPIQQVAPGLRTDPTKLGKTERLSEPQRAADSAEYLVWHKTESTNGPAGKYLVDATGAAVYFVDPGINGAYRVRPDGSEVQKFDAPKATLMSYIIKGILGRELPWALVLFGVMTAVVLELAGIASLAFAVGVYLPLAVSSTVFFGGMIRWLIDRQQRRAMRNTPTTEEEFMAESDRSPGVLMASGYIAGGAIAGIVVAFLAGVFGSVDRALVDWSRQNNPFFAGPNADWLSLIPFGVLMLVLYRAGLGGVFAEKRERRPIPSETSP